MDKKISALTENEGVSLPETTNNSAAQKIKLSRAKQHSVEAFVTNILAGDIPFLSRAITLVESTTVKHQQKANAILERCLPFANNSIRIGITGVPGVGKSTFIEAFGKHLTSQGKKVAVLAVDPSSSLNKGSILGDKTRMEELVTDKNATPVNESITQRFIYRHRLEKKNPNAAVSEAKEPIVYYLDRGTPEPVRSALLDGGRWWNQAFEAIGYKNAFQMKLLPEGADPLDIRYNMVQWVHRSTRGWSYGASISDPRTGEIIKGHVSLGSLRIRQDFLIAQALQAPYKNDTIDDSFALQMAIARIRQLSAHEIGHTLGFAH
ncbi:zinc-dependent metalloprotease, partial [bacterium]|nr:zinc-dependent metalloprotease [bacterium]